MPDTDHHLALLLIVLGVAMTVDGIWLALILRSLKRKPWPEDIEDAIAAAPPSFDLSRLGDY